MPELSLVTHDDAEITMVGERKAHRTYLQQQQSPTQQPPRMAKSIPEEPEEVEPEERLLRLSGEVMKLRDHNRQLEFGQLITNARLVAWRLGVKMDQPGFSGFPWPSEHSDRPLRFADNNVEIVMSTKTRALAVRVIGEKDPTVLINYDGSIGYMHTKFQPVKDYVRNLETKLTYDPREEDHT